MPTGLPIVMSKTTKASPTKRPTRKPTKSAEIKPSQTTWRHRLSARVDRLIVRNRKFLARRPHRSFRRTKRRDYRRSLNLPGYWAFTLGVSRELRKEWRTFLLLVVLYAVLLLVVGGVTSQDNYNQVSNLMQQSTETLSSGGWDKLGQAGLMLVATFASGPTNLSADQQIYLFIFLLFAWLSSVWLLREFKLKRKPRLRDGLYNAGAPFLSTLLVCILLLCQLLPIGIVALVYTALSSVGIVGQGFGSMLFWVMAVVVIALVLYWVTSTIIALVVVTLPGMYPMRAVRAAGDLVVSRRLRIMYRILWLLGSVAVAWTVIMVPLILLVTWISSWWSGMSSIPVMPFMAALMSAATAVWMSAYIYLLYRKVVDDKSAPAQ